MGFTAAALLLVLAGVALELWAGLELGWRRAVDLEDTPPDPALPRLVFRGPFGYLRHPQSLGLLLMLSGAAVGVRRPGLFLVAAVVGGLVVAMALRHDAELARQFGEAYARYRRAVPLLVPRLR